MKEKKGEGRKKRGENSHQRAEEATTAVTKAMDLVPIGHSLGGRKRKREEQERERKGREGEERETASRGTMEAIGLCLIKTGSAALVSFLF